MRTTRLETGSARCRQVAFWAGALALIVGAAEATPVASRLVALRKPSGTPLASVMLWRSAEGAAGTPVVRGNRAYFIEDGRRLCAWNLVTGKVAWRTPLPAATRFAPTVVGSLVLVYGPHSLHAFTASTGRLVWSFSLLELGENWSLTEKTQFASADGRLFICSREILLAMDLNNGQPIWATRNNRQAEVPTPVVLGQFLYVRSADRAEPWMRYLAADGTDARDETTYGPRDPNPTRAIRKSPASRAVVSSDRKTLLLLIGNRRLTYQAPAPFTIAAVVGETSGVLCVQLVAHGPDALGAVPKAVSSRETGGEER